MNNYINSIEKSDDRFLIEDFDITSLFGKEMLEEIQEKVSTATGLAFVTVDYKGEPVTELTAFTSFCQLIRQRHGSEIFCKSSDAYGAIMAAVTQKTNVYFCPCGLIEVAIPIIIKGHYLGGFIGGQIRCEDAPSEVCRLKSLQQHQVNYEENPETKSLFNEITKMRYAQFLNIADMVSMIITQVGEKELSRLEAQEITQQKKELFHKREQIIQRERDLKNDELNTLKAQINPHFLFNCLTTISNLAMIEDAPRTNEMTTIFAELLRINLATSVKERLLLEEINNIERYLKIQKIRFGDKFDYTIIRNFNEQEVVIPSFMLLPFVENAVVNGLMPLKEKGWLKITAAEKIDSIEIIIEDNGKGLSGKKISLAGESEKEFSDHGLLQTIREIRRRLVDRYGAQYDAVIENITEKGSICRISYPKNFNGKAG
ncbi:histidine kinase [Acetobacterium paludosum]|uniref:Histidine kinase n=1 Tax=Acetobacterium paludosum TaxID=52693 RepID=A0A923HWJ1_9FIRM|nr:PocR ligand-binding domain-containing protein [Acetobacterium paludosum]MBC3887919.1 histidine kinase [Acetobacterium paludosum]